MTTITVILCLVLLAIVVVQIGKVSELAAKIRGEEEIQERSNNRHAMYMMVFLVVFLVACIWSAIAYKDLMLGYGPNQSASQHGGSIDYLFDITLFFTGIVFVVTHIYLFYFSWKYRGRKGRKALFFSHDTKLEIVWTLIPAVVMAFLVISGLDAWNEIMADVPEGAVSSISPKSDDEYLEIEGMGYQYAWALRYPGADGKLGSRDYKKITGLNPMGQVWTDEKNIDDFQPSEIVLPKDRNIRVRITARDVLHNFYLPHFRVKMDAVPGLPTYFVFRPIKTTEEYREELSKTEYYQRPDPNDPSKMLWETFNYELACAELCGKGHFSMRRIVRIVEQDEYDAWVAQQQSYYLSSIRGTDEDPNKDELLGFEVKARKIEFDETFERALKAEEEVGKIVRFKYVYYETGSDKLTALSRYELDNLADAMNKYPSVRIQLVGHTDNTGDAAGNQTLSEMRAKSVYNYMLDKGIGAGRLSSMGYGQDRPLESNDTPEGKDKNRRTEFRIVSAAQSQI